MCSCSPTTISGSGTPQTTTTLGDPLIPATDNESSRLGKFTKLLIANKNKEENVRRKNQTEQIDKMLLK